MKMTKRLYRQAFLLLYLCLDACSAITLGPGDSPVKSDAVTVEYDPFKGITKANGPVVVNALENDTDAPEVEEISLRSQAARGQATRYFLAVTDYYQGDWRGFDQAFDLNGNKFHALAVRHHVECKFLCGFEEIIEVELNRSYLDAHANTGITMRLYGPSGAASAPFELPGSYIRSFLQGAYEK